MNEKYYIGTVTLRYIDHDDDDARHCFALAGFSPKEPEDLVSLALELLSSLKMNRNLSLLDVTFKPSEAFNEALT